MTNDSDYENRTTPKDCLRNLKQLTEQNPNTSSTLSTPKVDKISWNYFSQTCESSLVNSPRSLADRHEVQSQISNEVALSAQALSTAILTLPPAMESRLAEELLQTDLQRMNSLYSSHRDQPLLPFAKINATALTRTTEERTNNFSWYLYILNNPLKRFDLNGRLGPSLPMPSLMNNFFQKIGNFIFYLRRFLGKMISQFCFHFIPIPYVKDGLEFIGWCLQGKNPAQFDWNKGASMLMKYQGQDSLASSIRHVIFTGACVSKKECHNRLTQYSRDYGGVTVYGVYNGTNGFLLDAFEVVCQKIGIPIHAQKVAEREMGKLAKEMGKGGTFRITAHSQGTETIYNLSPELKQMMNVNALAPVRVLQKQDFKNAANFIAGIDVVPLLDPFGLVAGIRNGNVHYLPTSGCPFIDHYHDNKQFEMIRKNLAKEFQTQVASYMLGGNLDFKTLT